MMELYVSPRYAHKRNKENAGGYRRVGGEETGEERSVTKDKCVHRLEGVAGRRSVLTPR